jgi:hypothetical protein
VSAPADFTAPGIELVRLCRKVNMQSTYARWLSDLLRERFTGADGDGVCLLDDMLHNLERLAEDLEGAAENFVNAFAEEQSVRDRADGQADAAVESAKAKGAPKARAMKTVKNGSSKIVDGE